MFLRGRAHAPQRFRAHDRPVGAVAESVFQRDLDAERAARGDARHHGFRRVLGGIGALRQRMLARIRGLEDVVVEDLVADGLVDEHEWIAIDHRRHAAAVDVGMLRLRGEHRRRDRGGWRCRAPASRRSRGSCAAAARRNPSPAPRSADRCVPNGRPMASDTCTCASVSPGVRNLPVPSRRRAPAGSRDGLVADGGDAPVANQHVAIAERLRLLGRHQRDVLDEQGTSCIRLAGKQREIGGCREDEGDRAIHDDSRLNRSQPTAPSSGRFRNMSSGQKRVVNGRILWPAVIPPRFVKEF